MIWQSKFPRKEENFSRNNIIDEEKGVKLLKNKVKMQSLSFFFAKSLVYANATGAN